MADVFITFATKDRAAELIRDALETGGLTCWILPRDIRPAANWADAIAEAAAESRAVLCTDLC